MDAGERFAVLDETYLPKMAELYRTAFAGAPWYDDWSDGEQLMQYMKEISCSHNSLNFGLFEGERLIAVSVGQIRHWWEGTNYNLEEFCVSPECQGKGTGTRFMEMIAEELKKRGLHGIFLQTDSDKPAFGFYHKNGFADLERHVSLYRKL